MHPSFLSLDHNITLLSAFKTSATARYFFEAKDISDLPKLKESYDFATRSGLPIVYLGSGTNCLFAFDRFEGLIIKNGLKGWEIRENDAGRTLHAYSAELVSPIATALFKSNGISLFLPWVGLPGTVGGAVTGNAGCFGLEVADVVVHAEAFDLETGETISLSPRDLGFHYRESLLKGSATKFVISATFDLDRVFPENEFMAKNPEEMQQIRRGKQPPGLSCGSYFRNPPGDSAGRIIDKELGMNGTRVGDVQISERHGNFFLAPMWADWRDVLALAETVKNAAKNKLGIELLEEVRIISNIQN